MTVKRQSAPAAADPPVEVFRQFAWHLAGSLAAAGGKAGSGQGATKPRPAAKGTVRR